MNPWPALLYLLADGDSADNAAGKTRVNAIGFLAGDETPEASFVETMATIAGDRWEVQAGE